MQNLKDRVTIYQVAQAAGVSLATVSRVINKSDSVTPATRKKVQDTIEALGYKPSGLAQALATNRSTNIGVIIPSANYVYLANMLSGITEVAKEKNYTLTLFTTSHSRDEAISTIEKVITAHVDGTIIFDDQLSADDVTKIASYNVPSVVIDNKIQGDKVCDIRFSYDTALERLIRDYYERDNQNPMAFLHVHNAGRLLGRCEKVFLKTHEALGKDYRIVNCRDSYTQTYNQFQEYFKDPSNQRGFYICYRDSIAAAVLNAATDAGIKVPEQVEILSLVGTKYSYIVRPTLTAMHIDMQEVGKRAMYMLTDLLNQELVNKTAKIEANLVLGQSTKN
ncbi:MAG: LacI family DNA-binding transcriptional regulator [Bacilli bacterium]|nr:LacI family DNA-binding transcriptional regulator [Bacilli bacterium]MBO6285604.1 LacI family DNA-binding transcriptional regulator [Bacilli bacterium]